MKYQINLVRKLRSEEVQAGHRKFQTLVLITICFGVLALSVFFASLQVLRMMLVLHNEQNKLARIETEYAKYKETRMIVDKSDIELLDKLQNGRIFWTKKLASMAFYLPENYWITDFGYNAALYNVKGYGYISPKQEQLITLDDYLNQLRADSNFCDIFKTTYLNSTIRNDEGGRQRVSFDYSAPGAKPLQLTSTAPQPQ